MLTTVCVAGSVQAGSGAGGGHRGAGPGGAPGSTSGAGAHAATGLSVEKERLSLDVSMLKQQYCRLRERQRQAHIIVTAACGGLGGLGGMGASLSGPAVAMNHLLIGKPALRSAKGRRLPPPKGAVPPPAPRPSAAAPAPATKRKSMSSHCRTPHAAACPAAAAGPDPNRLPGCG